MEITTQDTQKLLTDVIKKQIVILGPDITLAKARNVPGLTIADDGTVTAITGNPQIITQQLVEQFMELSGLIVKKTMEPLLASFPADGNLVIAGVPAAPHPATPQPPPVQAPQPPVQATPTPQPVQSVVQPQVPVQPQTAPATIQNNAGEPVEPGNTGNQTQ